MQGSELGRYISRREVEELTKAMIQNEADAKRDIERLAPRCGRRPSRACQDLIAAEVREAVWHQVVIALGLLLGGRLDP